MKCATNMARRSDKRVAGCRLQVLAGWPKRPKRGAAQVAKSERDSYVVIEQDLRYFVALVATV